MNLELTNNQFLTVKQKDSRDRYLRAVEQINSFNGAMGVNGISTTKEAMDYVRTKIKSEPYYYSPDKAPFVIDNIEGLRFHILGPPEDSRSKCRMSFWCWRSGLFNSDLYLQKLIIESKIVMNFLSRDNSNS